MTPVAGQAAQSSGLAPELLKKMLPILAMLVPLLEIFTQTIKLALLIRLEPKEY